MYIRWLIFTRDLVRLYPAVYFVSMWLSGLMAIMNRNGDSAFLWNIIIIIIIIICEYSTSVLGNGLSQYPEKQQVSPSLQDSSQYSGLSL